MQRRKERARSLSVTVERCTESKENFSRAHNSKREALVVVVTISEDGHAGRFSTPVMAKASRAVAGDRGLRRAARPGISARGAA